MQGSILGLTIVGAFFIMKDFFWINLNLALILTFFYIVFCSLIMLFLQSILMKFEIVNETKKQTKILEKIEKKLDENENSTSLDK